MYRGIGLVLGSMGEPGGGNSLDTARLMRVEHNERRPQVEGEAACPVFSVETTRRAALYLLTPI